MAHSCPECDQVCHCGGDIDDIIIDGTCEQMECGHCVGMDDDEFGYDGVCDEDDIFGCDDETEDEKYTSGAF